MGMKREDGTIDDACLDHVQPGEPFFVLRAQDKLSAHLVRLWAELALDHGLPLEKYGEALRTAEAMGRWSPRRYPD